MAGYWGESGTQVTWKNPQFVPESQRQTGGWYYNPSTNRVDRWWNQGTGPQASSGGDGGQRRSEPAFDYEALIRRQEEQRKAKEEAQKKEQEGLFSEYETKLGGQETSQAAYNRLSTEFNVPELEQALGTFSENLNVLKTGLNEIDQAITERTQGKFVTEAQRARMVATERDKITTQMARLAEAAAPSLKALTDARGQIGTQLTLLAQDQQKALRPIEARINALSDRFAREMSGFNQDKENELNLLMTKLQREQTLADQEWAAAQQLLSEERAFQREKDMMVFEAEQKKANQGPATDPSAYFKTETAKTTPQGSAWVSEGGGGFSYNDWLNAGGEGFGTVEPGAMDSMVFQ